jgi:hypothetical protein
MPLLVVLFVLLLAVLVVLASSVSMNAVRPASACAACIGPIRDSLVAADSMSLAITNSSILTAVGSSTEHDIHTKPNAGA